VSLIKSRSTSNFSTPLYNPWLYFFVFTITNAFLAYGSLNFETNLYIALMGWAFPMILGLICFSKTHPESDLFHQEALPTIPISWWFGVAVLAAIPRLYLLLNSNWFVPDEGLFGTIALELIKKWKWDFFFTVAQHPPLSFWFASTYFKFFTPSVFSMRFFNLFLSIPIAIGVYWCCRCFFSKSITFLCCVLFAFSFWPLDENFDGNHLNANGHYLSAYLLTRELINEHLIPFSKK